MARYDVVYSNIREMASGTSCFEAMVTGDEDILKSLQNVVENFEDYTIFKQEIAALRAELDELKRK